MVEIRKAKREDTPFILEMIRGIAKYEQLLDQVEADLINLEKELFDEGNAFVIIAYKDKLPVAFALYFYNFSTFKGKKGLYLEDLFVLPDYRKQGIGNQLFEYLVNEAKMKNCGRIEWVCLNWNSPAIDFYEKKNAVPMNDWITFRLDELLF
ncbi:MAG: GNAT family N-acetyltransferase [Tenericutes bacterium]|nr:GNAT family N-acetyltransferase [Mycoplasmatota bacterium]